MDLLMLFGLKNSQFILLLQEDLDNMFFYYI